MAHSMRDMKMYSSPRVYQLHTLKDGQKELLVKIHLGEHMMLKAVVAAKGV